MSDLKPEELRVGHVYCAKRKAQVGGGMFAGGFINDREIRWINSTRTELQYDGPAVALGRRYPKVTVEAFLKWADKDITAKMPKGGRWRRF